MVDEKSSKKAVLLLVMLLVSLFTFFVVGFGVVKSSETLVVPDQFSTVGEAVEKAMSGDTIFVKASVYFENLLIDKSLNLLGEDSKSTVLVGVGNVERGDRAVLTVAADNVRISGFTIMSQNYSASSLYATGISIEGDNCSIIGNIICNSYYGIFSSAQSNITVSKNQIVSNLKDGIRFCGGSLNAISENNISDNAKGGIAIKGYSNTILKNNITDNGRGIGLATSHSLIHGNNISGNSEFNFFFEGSENLVSSNNISDSSFGIYFSPYFAVSINNRFCQNNFIGNGVNVGGCSPYNVQVWDQGSLSGGNYWSDYFEKYPSAGEVGNSGFGNIHYVIDVNNTDSYPLLAPVDISNLPFLFPKVPPASEMNGMVAFWPFDEVEPNGVTPDETGLNLAVVGVTSEDTSYTPRLVDGMFGKALCFDGAAYVTTPILPHLEFVEEAAIDVWINVQEFKDLKYNNIVVECFRTRAELPERTFGLAVNGEASSEVSGIPQGALLGYVYVENQGLNEIATIEPVVQLNHWIHVVFTRSLSSGMHIYVDGEEQNVTVTSGVQNPKGPIKRATELYIGHDGCGLIDELKLYDMDLEPDAEEFCWIQWSIWISILSIITGATLFAFFKFKRTS